MQEDLLRILVARGPFTSRRRNLYGWRPRRLVDNSRRAIGR